MTPSAKLIHSPNREEQAERARGRREISQPKSRSDTRSKPPPLNAPRGTAHPLLRPASPEIQVRRARSDPYGSAKTQSHRKGNRGEEREERRRGNKTKRGGRPATKEEEERRRPPKREKLGSYSREDCRERKLRYGDMHRCFSLRVCLSHISICRT
ncbi:unnamed protein product [Brassica rapa]|uniref:Uncharacterized protein n=2 Tax=Brassica TaxID=3705 RepID=A0A8D9M5U3_BRACM|nr:unnamed protein product [Brassica napus]CAG7899827.1 unnamed protein product [Brassica rapa]